MSRDLDRENLVQSMRSETMSDEAKARLEAALGIALGAGAAGATGVVAAKGAEGATTGASFGSKVASGAGVGLGKGIAVLSLALGAFGIAGKVFSDPQPPVRVLHPGEAREFVASAAVALRQEHARVATARDVPQVASASEGAPPHPKTRVAALVEPSSSADSKGQTNDLAGELRALDEVRASLRTGNASAALGRLSSYRKGASQTLRTEADALEIEALIAVGRIAEARAKGTTFLARNGRGPLSVRVEELLRSATQKK